MSLIARGPHADRTKALAAGKDSRRQAGCGRGARLIAEARQAARRAVAVRANARALDEAATVEELQAGGFCSLRAIAAQLNQRGVKTPRGVGVWQAWTESQLSRPREKSNIVPAACRNVLQEMWPSAAPE